MIIVQRLTFISLPPLKPIETHAEYTHFPAIREQWGETSKRFNTWHELRVSYRVCGELYDMQRDNY